MRHENVVRQMNRKHGAVGEPISVTTGQTRNQMFSLGILSPIRKSFMKKPVSSQDFYDNSSTIVGYKNKNKNKNTDTSTGSSDLTDKAMMLYLVSWAKEMQKDMQNIMIQNFTIINILNDLMSSLVITTSLATSLKNEHTLWIRRLSIIPLYSSNVALLSLLSTFDMVLFQMIPLE